MISLGRVSPSSSAISPCIQFVIRTKYWDARPHSWLWGMNLSLTYPMLL